MIWQTARFQLDLARPCIMGIVNVTPDSFSDGGQHASTTQSRTEIPESCADPLPDRRHRLDRAPHLRRAAADQPALLVLALERSLRSEADYAALGTWLNSPWRALLLVVMVWAATHHLLAGVRHMLMDIGIGSRLAQARMSAWSTIVAALLIALLAAMRWLS